RHPSPLFFGHSTYSPAGIAAPLLPCDGGHTRPHLPMWPVSELPRRRPTVATIDPARHPSASTSTRCRPESTTREKASAVGPGQNDGTTPSAPPAPYRHRRAPRVARSPTDPTQPAHATRAGGPRRR